MRPHSDHTETIEPGGAHGSGPVRLRDGTLFADRYRIERVLGTGGSAVVYAAYDTHVRQEIALKVLRADKESARSLTRFRREVAIARQLKAPNLVTVYDIGQVDTAVWISMELVQGSTLRELISNESLPIERAIAIGAQLLAALQGLHEHGVIHRDVKPGNIMITPEGDARLMDLGLARFYASDETQATTTEHVVGTLEYLSPEQALGEELDPRSDLYSFGLVLFEMLAGRLPFGEQTTLGHLISHVSRAAPDVRSIRPDVPGWLARIVAHLLEKKRENRYQSSEEVLRNLESRRASLLFGMRRTRARWVAALLAIVIAAGSIGGWRAWSGSRFDRIVADGLHYGIALDRKGRELWRKEGLTPGFRAATAQLERDAPRRVVGVISNPLDIADARRYTISILDAQTGGVLRSHTLPPFAPVFGPTFADTFNAADFDAVDLNHDGLEEVVAVWLHSPYWPSSTVYFDPALGDPRFVFYASGYHRFAGTADVDGDGIDEILLFGVNNRMGWHASLAAVSVARLREPESVLDDAIVACTPDAQWSPNSDLMLVWYTLVRPFGPSTRFPSVDKKNRQIRVDGPDEPIVIGFDGFVEGTGNGIPVEQRRAARQTAYRHFRDQLRLSATANWDDAIAASRSGLVAAREADDRVLSTLLELSLATALIHTGHVDEAESRLRDLRATTGGNSNIAWAAANAYHLTGDLARAISWYESVLNESHNLVEGRKLYEFLEGTLLALGESGDWSEARRLTAAFLRRAPSDGLEYSSIYEGWIEWRATGRPPDSVGDGEGDLVRYLDVEYALARGDDPAAVLSRADEIRPLLSGKAVLVDSIRAECLVRLGRAAEGYEVARDAWAAARIGRETDRLIRGHFDLVTQRLIRAAEAAGRHDDAVAARAELDRVWNRPTVQ